MSDPPGTLRPALGSQALRFGLARSPVKEACNGTARVGPRGTGYAAESRELTVEEYCKLGTGLNGARPRHAGTEKQTGDLREMTIADYVDSLVGDIESAGLGDIVVVGHSMGGRTTLPKVVTVLARRGCAK